MLEIDSTRTALLVMDFQNDMVDPEGAFASQGWASQVRETRAIENTARALAAARSAGLLVVHVGVAWRPGHPDANNRAPLFAGVKQANGLVEDTWGAEFHSELEPADRELVIRKRGVSALAGTELDRFLRLSDISAVVLTGFATTWVVEGTARDAVDRGYSVIVLADCCATFAEEMQRFALEVTLPLLGTVTTAEEFASAVAGVAAQLTRA
jgi:nicotinamidase-related amidase